VFVPADLPPSVQLVLDDYIELISQARPGLLAGLYLHGSLALGAYDPRLSDIDALTIASRRCAPGDVEALRAVHQALTQRHPRAQLELGYLQWQDLGGSEDSIPPHPHIHDGILHPSGYHDINDVTWWVLKHHGIAVLGPPPAELGIVVDWGGLIAGMHHNLNTYWASFTTSPRRMAWLLSDYGVQWAVLGVLRQFYSFREGAITSKIDAGRYGLAQTSPQWRQLIQAAIDIRAGVPARAYRSRLARAVATRAFVQLIIAACRADTG
jgi:hypothetical protein